MKKISTMGEMLVDFVPLEDQRSYAMKFGGAPANVAAVVGLLGGDATFYGQVGDDPFGTFLIDELDAMHVDSHHVIKTKAAKTGITFVTLDKDGNRSFNFYRNPSADMLYSAADYQSDHGLEDAFAFSSISLIDYPVKDAHEAIIETIKAQGGLIVFDVNLRIHLWDDHQAYRSMIRRFIERSNIVKISDDELEFVTQTKTEKQAIEWLQSMGVEIILLTRGNKGSTLIRKNRRVNQSAYTVESVDTTGAGDAFLGAFLYQWSVRETPLATWTKKDDLDVLKFANAVAAISTTMKGALDALKKTTDLARWLESLAKKSTSDEV